VRAVLAQIALHLSERRPIDEVRPACSEFDSGFGFKRS
jgi:hypothetical protein